MKKFLLVNLITVFAFSVSAQGQTQEIPKEKIAFSHLGVAVGTSTLGLGIEAATPIHKNFTLRGGINFMGYTSGSFTIDLDDDDRGSLKKAYGYVPEYEVKGKLSFVNGNVLVDWHPMRNGIFHFTTGFYIGSNKIKADGYLANPQTGERATLLAGQTPPTIQFEDYELKVKEDASMNADLTLGKAIKPYFGLGLGKSITKSRVGFKFELGALYQGKYSLKQNGEKLEINDNSQNSSMSDVDKYTKWLKWWPMLNFQLTYRIF